MRLCRETRGVREWLQDGSLNLSNAALLQNSFERWDRSAGGRAATGSPGAGTSAAPRVGSAPSATPGEAESAPSPVLDAHARQRLVEQAVGKSTRQVQQMLAEVDPEAAVPGDRLRALGDGRWELKAVIDAECQQGLQQLRELLSHVDPHLTVGQLVGRLVREGLERYDPSRPPRRKRRKSDPAGDECSAETAGREKADCVAAAVVNPRRAEQSAAPTTSPSAPKRSAKPAADRTSAPKRAAPPADRGRTAGGAAATEPTSAAKPRVAVARSTPERSTDGAGSTKPTSAAKSRVAAGSSTTERRAGAGELPSVEKSRGSSGRSIPAAVKREVWRRDQGCCTFVDRDSGRRCGSRFFLEMDHIVPVAVGGAAEPGNLVLRCAAHHRYRHLRQQRSAPRDSVT